MCVAVVSVEICEISEYVRIDGVVRKGVFGNWILSIGVVVVVIVGIG